jgi:hypothetical protein
MFYGIHASVHVRQRLAARYEHSQREQDRRSHKDVSKERPQQRHNFHCAACRQI